LVFSDGKTFTYSTSNTVALQPGYISAMDAFTCEYFSGGSGSKANPYRIANEADLTSMRTKVQSEDTDDFRNKHYILLADIDFNNTSLGTIGTESTQSFTGTFDGQGHTIRNVVFFRSQKWARCGFIGTLDGSLGSGVLKNLNIVNAVTGGDVISGSTRYPRWNDYTAIFAARAINGALIENCHVDGCTIDSEASYVGAIAGELNASTIRNCSATSVNIRGCGGSGNEGVGGLVGSVTGTSASLISNCTCSGSVTAIIRTDEMAAKGGPAARDAHHGGGIAGTVRSSPGSTVEHCSFTGTLVSEGGALAGVVGDMKGSTVIRNCTVGTGTTITGGSSQNNIGGIAGYVYSRDSGVSAGEISGCTFRGSVTGSGERTAGIVAVDGEVAVNNCTVENASITGVLEVGGIVGSLGGQTVRSSFVKSSSITGSNIRVGGIVGRINGTNAVITDCGVETTTVQGTGNFDEAYVGGIIGVTDNTGDSTPARIVRCYSSGGSVSAIGRKVGGIAGALTSRSLVDGCWSTTDVLSDVSTGGYSGHVGGIVGSLVQNAQNTMVINCTYYGGSVKDLGSNHGAAAGIVGSVAYTYAVGDIMPNYVVNCFANPKEVSTGQYAVGGVGGYLTRDIMDNCYSPTPSASLKRTNGSSNNTGSLIGTMRRGGRIVNCYSLFQGSGSHDTGTDAATVVEDTWQVTILSDADMKATSKTITVASSGASAASLTDALNKGAVLYNNGGDGIAHHGTLPFGARAQSWVKSTDEGAGKGYPVLSCSPLCDADPDTYAHTVTVDNPNLTIYMPPMDSKFKGKLIILVPGGGYHYLASVTGNEGEGWVSYYNDLGYACAVLRYTLPGGNPALPIADLENAIKYVRDHSSSLHINSVGVHGFSAGGHLASTIATHYTAATRPDFQILFYPVITMGTGTHANSKNNFLGTSPSAAMVTLYSNQLQVTADTPQAFVMYNNDDATVAPASNGAAYVSALTTAIGSKNVKSVVFSTGGHAWSESATVTVDGETATVKGHLQTWLKSL
ncbi:MAG: alpha/beta hydrolase, partial [Bacteroidales bacterium]|nr:alpha/beta hydrolase [Bacteroidales bacterium]